MPMNQTLVDLTLQEIRDVITRNRKRRDDALALLALASGAVSTAQTQHTQFNDNLNDDALNNPLDQVIQRSKETKDKYLQEFISLKNDIDAKLAAAQGA